MPDNNSLCKVVGHGKSRRDFAMFDEPRPYYVVRAKEYLPDKLDYKELFDEAYRSYYYASKVAKFLRNVFPCIEVWEVFDNEQTCIAIWTSPEQAHILKRHKVSYLPPRPFCWLCGKRTDTLTDCNGKWYCNDCMRANHIGWWYE